VLQIYTFFFFRQYKKQIFYIFIYTTENQPLEPPLSVKEHYIEFKIYKKRHLRC